VKLLATQLRRSRTLIRDLLRRVPVLKDAAVSAVGLLALGKHTVAAQLPGIIKPRTRSIAIALTANCNLRCIGCRYGRDFMPGKQLSLAVVREILNDAADLRVHTARLYGGEPLLHPDLPAIVRHCIDVGIKPWVTTNGILLRRRIDELFEAGLREMTIGLYGTGEEYDEYVQRRGRFQELEKGLTYLRERYGNTIAIKLSYLITRFSCEISSLRNAFEMARHFRTFFSVDLVHYSLPYFTEGPDRYLQFTPTDELAIRHLADELLRIHTEHPEIYRESVVSIRAIPEWALRGPDMRVPCDMYNFLWIGADGSVQLCYAAFPLGNVNEKPLRDIAYQPAHIRAARDAFQLNCPNCHCERETRIQKHLPSRLAFGLRSPSLFPQTAHKADKSPVVEGDPSSGEMDHVESE